MSRRHGDTVYILPEGGVVTTPTPVDEAELLSPTGSVTADDPTIKLLSGGIKGGWLIKDAPASEFSVAALRELSKVMVDMPRARDPARPDAPLEDVQSDNPSVPAGYTYLGQFINHDLTFNPTRDKPADEYDAEERERAQLPSFDLGCVYGAGPRKPSYERLYGTEFPRMLVGPTLNTIDIDVGSRRLENDLRREGSHSETPLKAVIADERNDDNLPLAQTHVAFLRFHNRVVKLLKAKLPGLSDDQLFHAARREVILCYQRIVLYDYLPKVVERATYEDVLSEPHQPLNVNERGELFLPLEFSRAAFRMGHSMVRNTYSWNRLFQAHNPQRPGEDVAQLHTLFKFTGNGSMGGLAKTLLTKWIIDWRRFYDFSGLAAGPPPPLNTARKIDTRLPLFLSTMPRLKDGKEETVSLAFLDLLAGNKSGDKPALPSGQAAATGLNVPNPLTDEEMAGGPDGEVLRNQGLDKQTPLWYYILKEAVLREGGERLGPVGSRIVAETIFGVLRWSQPYSILRGDKSVPELAEVSRMVDLLWMGLEGDVNPLG